VSGPHPDPYTNTTAQSRTQNRRATLEAANSGSGTHHDEELKGLGQHGGFLRASF
jgi:hypothetical protein